MKLAVKGPLMPSFIGRKRKKGHIQKDGPVPYRQIYNHVYKQYSDFLTQKLSRSCSHFNTSIETD